ncbi:hypothetical protein GJ496_010341 [Pomphorhynchus laevis]|nr:hypothetical protein GJ496_010341 [Pomphorhynchus laevis]
MRIPKYKKGNIEEQPEKSNPWLGNLTTLKKNLDITKKENTLNNIIPPQICQPKTYLVRKKDDVVRICADFRTILDQFVAQGEYQMPMIENTINKERISSNSYRSKHSEYIGKIYTICIFSVHPYVFWNSSESSGVSTVYGSELKGIEGVTSYLDDVVIATERKDQHLRIFHQVFHVFE